MESVEKKEVEIPIEEFQERVKVIAETEVIDLDQSQQSTKFSENFLSDLPVPGRFYQNVLTMAPGVQDADGDGNFYVHGSRSRETRTISIANTESKVAIPKTASVSNFRCP